MHESVTAIIQEGLQLEQQGLHTDALKHYAQSGSTHPSLSLRMAHIAAIIDNRLIAEKMHTFAAINPDKISYHDAAISAGLPDKAILMVDYYWFSFSAGKIVQPVAANGFNLVLSPHATKPIDLPDLTIDNALSYTRHGFSLLDLCVYDLCALMELDHPTQIDPSDAAQWPIIQAVFNHAAALLDIYVIQLAFYKPVLAVYPQGYMLAASILRHLAHKHNIRTVALENICDPTRLLYETETGISVTHNSVASRFMALRDTLDQAKAESYWTDYYANIKTQRHGEHQSPDTVLSITKERPEQKIAIFLAQVGTDSSVLFGLKHFSSQADVIIQAAQAVIAQGHIFVIKLHPKEKEGTRPVDLQPYRQLTLRHLEAHPDYATLAQNPHIVIDRDNAYDTYHLIEQSDMCITINSQCGFEASCMGKPVIICGDCTYSEQGFTHDGTYPDKLKNAITDLLSHDKITTQTDLARLFLYHYTRYCATERTPEALAQLIVRQANTV